MRHVGQAARIIIPDCKRLYQAFMQFVLGDSRDFGVLRAHISIWKSSSCDMSPRRGSPATRIVFCIAVSTPWFTVYKQSALNAFHAAKHCQPVTERCKMLNVSPNLCVCLSLSLLIVHCEALKSLPAVSGRSYGYTLGRSPCTATINTQIHTYRRFPSAN